MYRINVVGSSGSGKSSLSRKLAKLLDAPYFEMDKLFWCGNWQEVEDKKFIEGIKTSVSHDSWVLDGNYNRTREVKWKNATHIIWVDYSFTRTLYQSLKRSTQRIISQEPHWEGTECKETFIRTYLNKNTSILWWMITNYKHNRRRYLDLLKNGNEFNVPVIHLQSPEQTKNFLENCTSILKDTHRK